MTPYGTMTLCARFVAASAGYLVITAIVAVVLLLTSYIATVPQDFRYVGF